MPLADHDYVVKAFPTNRANHRLGVRVLPGRAGRNYRFSDAQCLGLTRKSFSINLVSIPNQLPGPLLQRARLEQLACRPFRSRMLRDIEMHQPASAVGQDHEHEQHPKGRGGNREQIQRDQVLRVILQKRAPRLRRRPPRADHVLRNRRLRDRQTELQQLAVDPWRTPKRIGVAHPPNQISELCTDQGPTGSAPTLPRPVAPKSLPVPANHRLRPHYQQRMSPARPQLRQENPEDSVHLRQPRPRFASLPHGQLLPKRQVLEREVAVRAKTASQCPNEDSEPSDHDREIADQSAKCKFIAQDDFLEGTPQTSTKSNWWPQRDSN